MQVILNKKEKEELVVKLHEENKTLRQIAEIVHMSFSDIGRIVKKLDGRDTDINHSNKSKATQADIYSNRARSQLMWRLNSTFHMAKFRNWSKNTGL